MKIKKKKKKTNNQNQNSKPGDNDINIRGNLIIKKNVENENSLEDDNEKKKAVRFTKEMKNVQKKLEMVENIMGIEKEDQVKIQIDPSKRNSVSVVEFSSFKIREFQSGKNLLTALFEIKEEFAEDKKEKEEPNTTVSSNKVASEKPKEMKRTKTDGVLQSAGGDAKAAEDRKNRLAKRLSKAKQLVQAHANANKYRKSVDITMKASILNLKLTEQKEDNK